jgi:UDP-glucose 4-epimerase
LKRVLITGSEGFIGKSFCNQLSQHKEEYEVFTLSRSAGQVRHIRADITVDNLTPEIRDINPEIIVHLAGNVSVPFSIKYPLEDFNVNARGTLAVLLASEHTDCKNFIFVTSGGAIYDSKAPSPLTEFSPVNPISPYGLSKYIAEGYVRVLSEARKSEWSSLALSNAYGSVKIQKQGVIYRFWNDISNGINPTIFGAEVSRDFIHIDDVVNALIKVIEKPVNSRLNISSNTSTKLVDLLAEMQCIMGSSFKPIIQDSPLGEVGTSQLSNKRAQELLNWVPKVDLFNSLKDILSVS